MWIRELLAVARGRVAGAATFLLAVFVLAAMQASASPVITQLRPTSGAAAGGNLVLLDGSAIDPADTVQVAFDGQPATVVEVIGGTQLLCISPAHAPGDVTLEVKNGDGGTAMLTFTYEPETDLYLRPKVLAAGGGLYNIHGSDFVEGMKLVTGFTDPENPTANIKTPTQWSPTQLIKATGGGAVGSGYNVVVKYPDERLVTVPGFLSFVAVLPTLDTFMPDRGAASGGTRVYLEGTHIEQSPETQVLFGDVPGTDLQFHTTANGDEYISCLSPAHAVGLTEIGIRNPDGGMNKLIRKYFSLDYPDYDPCATAEAIAPSGSFTTFALDALGHTSCGTYGIVRWFEITCPADGTLNLSTCTSTEAPHATLAIFDACGDSGNELACGVRTCGIETEIVDFPVTACTTYYVQVGSMWESTFQFTLSSAFDPTGTAQECGVASEEVVPCVELVNGGDMEPGGHGEWTVFAGSRILEDPENAHGGAYAFHFKAYGGSPMPSSRRQCTWK